MHFHSPIEGLSGEERWKLRAFARSMPLKGTAKSAQAQALIDDILSNVVFPFSAGAKQLRPTTAVKHRAALEAFLADLFAAAKRDKWGQCATNHEALGRLPFKRSAFNDVRKALQAGGFVEELRGFKKTQTMFNGVITDYERTCFRPTLALLQRAQSHAVRLENLSLHFASSGSTPVIPTEVLERRAKKIDGAPQGSSGALMPIDPDDATAASLKARMDRLNAFLIEEGRVDGILFGGLRRIFNNADQAGFNWQWGGRLYSMPGWDAYENMHGKAAARAASIILDGEEVREVDISAAHLTVLYALLDLPFDSLKDPYETEGFGRQEVKDWVRSAIGAADPSIGGNRYKQVRTAARKLHPVLEGLKGYGIGALDLQFHESEIILNAVEGLRDLHGVTCLPIHDGLIVPMSKRDLAHGILVAAFQSYFSKTLGKKNVPCPRVT